MRKLIILVAALLASGAAIGQSMSGGYTNTATTNSSPSFTKITRPQAIAVVGTGVSPVVGSAFPGFAFPSDGYAYYMTSNSVSGTARYANIQRTLASTMLTSPSWQDMSGTPGSGTNVCSSPQSSYLSAMTSTPNGTILAACAPQSGGTVDVYVWNGSYGASASWTKVTGYAGVSANIIYMFAQDAAGITYFSPTWSGDIWSNGSANSTVFTKVVTNFYGITIGGAAGSPTTGGLYQLRIWDLSDGLGEKYWNCGEGELDSIPLSMSLGSLVRYGTNTAYTGNCTNLDKSATTVGFIRSLSDGSLCSMTRINIATKATATNPCATPRTATGSIYNINTGAINALHYVPNTTGVWLLSAGDVQSVNGLLGRYNLISTDDMVTWADITAKPGAPLGCTSTAQALTSGVMSHYILLSCFSGKEYWAYGPFN